MRKLFVAVVGAALLGGIFAASSASADPRHCYTVGVPGQDHYTYCTYLPVDPNDILR